MLLRAAATTAVAAAVAVARAMAVGRRLPSRALFLNRGVAKIAGDRKAVVPKEALARRMLSYDEACVSNIDDLLIVL